MPAPRLELNDRRHMPRLGFGLSGMPPAAGELRERYPALEPLVAAAETALRRQ